jgi:putative membrane protein
MFCNGFGGYGGPNFFMIIPMIIILLTVVYFMYKAINSKNLNPADVDTSLSKAMAILNERFAKGEINEEEYTSRKNQLRK